MCKFSTTLFSPHITIYRHVKNPKALQAVFWPFLSSLQKSGNFYFKISRVYYYWGTFKKPRIPSYGEKDFFEKYFNELSKM